MYVLALTVFLVVARVWTDQMVLVVFIDRVLFYPGIGLGRCKYKDS